MESDGQCRPERPPMALLIDWSEIRRWAKVSGIAVPSTCGSTLISRPRGARPPLPQ